MTQEPSVLLWIISPIFVPSLGVFMEIRPLLRHRSQLLTQHHNKRFSSQHTSWRFPTRQVLIHPLNPGSSINQYKPSILGQPHLWKPTPLVVMAMIDSEPSSVSTTIVGKSSLLTTNLYLVGGFNRSETYEFVSWDHETHNIWRNEHGPNHQAAINHW